MMNKLAPCYAQMPNTNIVPLPNDHGDMDCYILSHLPYSKAGSADQTMGFALDTDPEEIREMSCMGTIKLSNLPFIESGRSAWFIGKAQTEQTMISMVMALDFIRDTLLNTQLVFQQTLNGLRKKNSVTADQAVVETGLSDSQLADLRRLRHLLPFGSEIMLVQSSPADPQTGDFTFSLNVLRNGEPCALFESAANYVEQYDHLLSALLCANLARPLRDLLNAIEQGQTAWVIADLMWQFNNACEVSRYQRGMIMMSHDVS